MNSKQYTQKSSKEIATFQLSFYGYLQCCSNVQIVANANVAIYFL